MFIAKIKCVKVRALFEENKVRRKVHLLSILSYVLWCNHILKVRM